MLENRLLTTTANSFEEYMNANLVETKIQSTILSGRVLRLATDINLLNRQELDQVKEFLNHNEWGLAFEDVLYAIRRSRKPIPLSFLQEIDSLAAQMGMSVLPFLSYPEAKKSFWQRIKGFCGL